jgi:hypothetical protein
MVRARVLGMRRAVRAPKEWARRVRGIKRRADAAVMLDALVLCDLALEECAACDDSRPQYAENIGDALWEIFHV